MGDSSNNSVSITSPLEEKEVDDTASHQGRTDAVSQHSLEDTNTIMERLMEQLPQPSPKASFQVKQIAGASEEKVCMLPQASISGTGSPEFLFAYSHQPQKQVSSNILQNIIPSGGVQSPSSQFLPPSGITKTVTTLLNGVDQTQSFQKTSETSVPQRVSSNTFTNSQTLMQGWQHREQIVAQQQFQNFQQCNYQKQLQNQTVKHSHYGNNQALLMQSKVHHSQNNLNITQSTHLLSSWQFHMHALQGNQLSQTTLQKVLPLIVSTPSSGPQQNQQFSVKKLTSQVVQQAPQLIPRNQQWIHHSMQQQKVPMTEQSMLSSEHSQQVMRKPPDETSIQQNQLIPMPCSGSGEQEKQQWLGREQIILSRMQQEQQQQQQLGQLSESQLSQQQFMSQLQRHQAEFQQQLVSQNKSSPSQRSTNQRILPSSLILEPQNSIEHQNQLFRFQNISSEASPIKKTTMLMSKESNVRTNESNTDDMAVDNHLLTSVVISGVPISSTMCTTTTSSVKSGAPICPSPLQWLRGSDGTLTTNSMFSPPASNSETIAGHADGSGGAEVLYQKIKSMQIYKTLLMEWYKKISSCQLGQFQRYEGWLEMVLKILNWTPTNIPPCFTMKQLLSIERSIMDFINKNRGQTNILSQQQGKNQHHSSNGHSLQTQIPQLQHADNRISTHLHAKNLRTSATLERNAVANDSMPSPSSNVVIQATQPLLVNAQNCNSYLESLPRSSNRSLQQAAVQSLENIPSNATQQAQTNIFSQNDLQPKVDFIHPDCGTLYWNLKQQVHPRQLSHQLIQQQKLLQQRKDQQKLQQSTHISACQIPQHQKMGSQIAYSHQATLKSGTSFHASSPQPNQAAASGFSQHSSPSALSKYGTPLQPERSPVLSLSPSDSHVPSPVPRDHERQTSSTSSHSNAENRRQMQVITSGPQSQSVAVSMAGISASPMLAEFPGLANNQGTAATTISDKTSNTETAMDRLIRVVKSMSSNALDASVSDIASAVSLVDMVAETKPNIHLRAVVGEDLAASTKNRMLGTNILSKHGIATTNNIRQHSSCIPLTAISSDCTVIDIFKLSNSKETSDLESTATSRIKRTRVEVNQALLKEIQEINQRLLNTVVEISEDINILNPAVSEVGPGTIVACSFTLPLRRDETFPVLRICLLISSDYPNCSPILLDDLPQDLSEEHEALLIKARLEFSRSLRNLSQPMKVAEIAKSWDACARAVALEYCVKKGGGSFSTRYGGWKTVSAPVDQFCSLAEDRVVRRKN